MVILSLGSNLPSTFGDRFDNLICAISLMKKNKIEVDKKSSFYETLSYPDNTNPKFINMVMVDGKKSVAERIVYGAFAGVDAGIAHGAAHAELGFALSDQGGAVGID